MSVQRKSIPAREADLESTAELPVLDVAAYEAEMPEERVSSTDTWVVPAITASAMVAAVAEDQQRTQIEVDLRALSANLREVEERLTRKGQRLIEIENQLAESRAERAALEQRGAALVAELASARAGMTAAEELSVRQRQELEGQLAELRRASEAQTTHLKQASEKQAGELKRAADARAAQLEQAIEAKAAELKRAIDGHDSAARSHQSRIQELASQVAMRERSLAVATADAQHLETRLASYLEVLQSNEGRREMFVGELLGLDTELDARNTRLGEIEIELKSRSTQVRELTAELEARAKRVVSLESEINALAAALAQRNAQIENSERAQQKLHAMVSELTESLAARSERVSALEGESARHAELSAERQREVSRLRHERDELQSKKTALEVALVEQKGRSEEQIAAAIMREAEHQEASKVASANLKQLEESLAVNKHSVLDLTGELTGARRTLEERTGALRTALDERTAALTAQIAEREAALRAELKARESELQAQQSSAQAEWEKRTAALNAQIAEREATLRAELKSRENELLAEQTRRESEWQARLAEQDKRLAERETELKAQIGERDARLQHQLTEHQQLISAAQTQAQESVQRGDAAEERVRGLEADISEQIESARALQEEMRAGAERKQELESDLTAAEDTIHRLETELRAKTARLDELVKTSEEWRSVVEEAKYSLEQRDSFIHRLEEEAAQSAMVLGNIQQSIKRMDPATTTGPHEIVPEGAVRLMIRADGETEVVHVLGRKTTIGRTSDNDLQIETKFISRHHAVILAGPNYTIIEDLNSTNGVLVNGRRVTRHTLKDGDAVTIGRSLFRFAVRPTRGS